MQNDSPTMRLSMVSRLVVSVSKQTSPADSIAAIQCASAPSVSTVS